eukprot:GHVN01005849.1.p1 GENE.GHVN01005849.1~~GHVN01005849.1.p1  ORF type:complete len:300 (+),score=35.19 GHVN01005849.1:1051-1950(+)
MTPPGGYSSHAVETNDRARVERDSVVLNDASEIKTQILDNFDVFLLDMDGVLWRGSETIDGAQDAVTHLDTKKKLYFITNNSIRTRLQYQKLLADKGFKNIPLEKIYCTSYAMAKYLKSINFSGKCYIIGNEAMREEIKMMELDVDDMAVKVPDRKITPMEFSDEPVDNSIKAVVFGYDPEMNYYKMAYATLLLNQNPDCSFLATNADMLFPTGDRELPGTGAFLVALESAAGKKAQIVGKPGAFILDEIMQECGVDRSRICMVGDNLLTDIAFANANGVGESVQRCRPTSNERYPHTG